MIRWPAILLLFGFVLLTLGCSESSDKTSFAGLATNQPLQGGAAFLQPGPGDRLTFPADLGPHPQHRIEWWYLTANLKTANGQPVGVQWTQFRQALQPRPADERPPSASLWPLQAAWMAHAALSWNGEHYFTEKLARGDVGSAGATAAPFSVWLDNWQLEEQPAHQSAAEQWRLQVASADWSYDLMLTINGPPVAHGDHGFSAKSASGEGSMYFSLTDIAIEGQVTIHGKPLRVSGQGWFDREWSSQFLKKGQQGWDWFALHLDSGDKLMAFRLREDKGVFQSGTWIPKAGKPVALAGKDFALTPQAGNDDIPRNWHLQVPDYDIDIHVSAPTGDYWNNGLYPYWESPVTVSGSHGGVGYMELTGH
ncbi:MAG TPA: lipocalin-like domain-containing protein [Marinobacter sp.]|nr:lipocalin-like domain-containing protein [Marinobacter sp.]